MKTNRQKRYKIEAKSFEALDNMDRLVRDHNFQAMIIGNEIMRKKMELAVKNDPELKVRWEKGFVDIGIDWVKKELVVSPTMDQQKKGEEVAHAISNKNGKTTDTQN